ncbi:g5235 [Coccomyxa viridis]|uniref:G5235 protein n=1 Tax=Coccomyxa viridis TaxID=1274662 RepID=A0ABP1FUW2_9CHLO
MQNAHHPFEQELGSAPEPASLEVDLAFLEEFLGEDLDIDEPLLSPDGPLDLSAADFSHVADALPALSPFQRSFQQLAPPEPEHRGAQYRPVTPLQTAASEGTRDTRPRGAHSSKQYRSGRQQELNKAAQVRYRQRKKSRAEELRTTVAALTERIQELGVQKQEHAELHARHEQLQHALRLHEQGSPSLARGPSLEAGSESAQAPGNVAPEDEDPQDAEGVPEGSLEHRQERLHDVVQLLKQGIDSGWGSAEPFQAAGQHVAYDRLLQEAIDLFVTSGGPTGLESTVAARSEGPAAASSLDRSWLSAETSLRLFPAQLQSLLQLRTEQMLKEEALGEKKSAVRRKAVAMLQQAQASIAASAHSDFFTRAHSRSTLSSIVRELRTVLREETKSREDAARALLQHILVPAQAAALLVAIHPAACDVAMLWQLLLRAPCQ